MTRKMVKIFLYAFLFSAKATTLYDTTIIGKDTVVICSTKSEGGSLIGYKEYKNSKIDGITKEWYENGMLRRIQKFKSGCPQDTVFKYHSNGAISAILPYKNCVREGLRIEFSITGDTIALGNAKKGKAVGTHYAWYEKGKRKFITTYNDSGKKDGLSVRWREDGTVIDSVLYRNEEIIEGWHYYDNGKLHYIQKKKGNDKYYSMICYDPKGKKCGEVKNGNGTYIFYRSDGTTPVKITNINDECVSIENLDPITLKVIDPSKTPEAIKKRIADSLGLKAMGAIKNDNVDSIKSLLKSGFDINTVFRDPEYLGADITMLHFAALLKKEKIARFLMDNGADPNIYENQSRLIAAEVALECRYDFDFVKIFLERVDMSKGGPIGFMKNVLRADSLRLFKYMVDKGFEPYEISDEEINVFQIAAFNGSVKCLKYLFTIRDVPEFKEEDGFSIYHCAACSKKNGVETIKLLVENGVSTSYICQRDKSNSFTPYDYAVRHASRCSSYETQKREQYLKTAAYLKELQKKYCGIKDTNEKR